MSLLTDAKTKTLSDLANIVDAQFAGDPLGTDANALYFQSNVHNYIKALANVALPERTYFVDKNFEGLGAPYFKSIADAQAEVASIGSNINNKATIILYPKPDSYIEDLPLAHNGYTILRGMSRYGTVLSGNLTISAGIYIFDNTKFEGDIEIAGATAVFANCTKTDGTFEVNNGGKCIIFDAEHWSGIEVYDDDSRLFLDNIKYIDSIGSIEVNPPVSIYLATTLNPGVYVLKNLELKGIVQEDVPATETKNVTPLATERPIIY